MHRSQKKKITRLGRAASEDNATVVVQAWWDWIHRPSNRRIVYLVNNQVKRKDRLFFHSLSCCVAKASEHPSVAWACLSHRVTAAAGQVRVSQFRGGAICLQAALGGVAPRFVTFNAW